MQRFKELFWAWFQAARPPFYIVTLTPLTLGFVWAAKNTGQYRWGLFGLILLASFLVHMATNIANDLFDFAQGVDSDSADDATTVGGSRVLQQGKLSARALALAVAGLYAAAFALAVAIIHQSGRPVLWPVVAFAAFSSFFYVAPPIKYGHRALGEVFVFINFGLIMAGGTYLALAGTWDRRVLALAVPIAFMVAGILYYQSLPEIDTDKAAGKRTLAGVLGKRAATFLYAVWWPVVYVLMLNLWLARLAAWPVFLCLLTLPLHRKVLGLLRQAGEGDWLWLDGHGHLVRKLYLINGVLLVVAVGLN